MPAARETPATPDARALRTTPGAPLPPSSEGRLSRGRFAAFLAVGALLAVAVVVVIVVITSGGSDENATVADTATTPTTPAATSAAPATGSAPAAAPASQARQVEQCDPIFGNGVPHAVTSSARAGQTLTGCGEAHSVLLAALNGQAASVGGWNCVNRPNARTLATCTSGGRTITARD